jgi:hypothetical protein
MHLKNYYIKIKDLKVKILVNANIQNYEFCYFFLHLYGY